MFTFAKIFGKSLTKMRLPERYKTIRRTSVRSENLEPLSQKQYIIFIAIFMFFYSFTQCEINTLLF